MPTVKSEISRSQSLPEIPHKGHIDANPLFIQVLANDSLRVADRPGADPRMSPLRVVKARALIAGGKGCSRQLLFSGLGDAQALALMGATSEWPVNWLECFGQARRTGNRWSAQWLNSWRLIVTYGSWRHVVSLHLYAHMPSLS